MRRKVTAFLVVGLLLVGCQPKMGLEAQSERWYVSQVLDGKTLVADREGPLECIQLCGIEVPEAGQPMGEAATAKLRELVAERYVMLVSVEQGPDSLIAEVFMEPTQGTDESERFIQEELLLAGVVRLSPEVERCLNAEPMKLAEAIAKEQQVGIWAEAEQVPLGK